MTEKIEGTINWERNKSTKKNASVKSLVVKEKIRYLVYYIYGKVRVPHNGGERLMPQIFQKRDGRNCKNYRGKKSFWH